MSPNTIRHYNNSPDNTPKTFFFDDCPSCVSIVGRSEATAKTLRMTRLVARSSCNPVLIVGEIGTGKELTARAVHILWHGSGQKLVAINCAAMTANLLESELFGHVKGAFTSAHHEKTGLLELAETGSIFLDEISEVPIDLQARLLRVVQEKTFRKVGGVKDIKCKATIIASSNRNLLEKVEKGNSLRKSKAIQYPCPQTPTNRRSHLTTVVRSTIRQPRDFHKIGPSAPHK